jgi:hypothetical protein
MGLGKYVKNQYDKKLTATGDKIVIHKVEAYHTKKYGDIHIAEYSQGAGHNLTKGTVVSIGPDAEYTGLNIGDSVLVDHFAIHYLTHPIACLSAENVICIINE